MNSPELPSYDEALHLLAVAEAKLYVAQQRLKGLIIIAFALLFNFLLATAVACHLFTKLHFLPIP